MSQADKIMVAGANGRLGAAILQELGPDKAIAVTRSYVPALANFQQINIAESGSPPAELLMECSAVINAAGSVSGTRESLRAANVEFPFRIARAAKESGVRKFLQVSSFSVLGAADLISVDSAVSPNNSYGYSKAEAEEKLSALAGERFSVECMRLPFMFSAQQPGLLKKLLQIIKVARCIPQYKNKVVQRSMITYSTAAKHLVMRAQNNAGGITFCADTELFTYDLLKVQLKNTANVDVNLFKIPSISEKLFNFIASNQSRRIFHSSILESEHNLFDKKYSELSREIELIIKAEFQRC